MTYKLAGTVPVEEMAKYWACYSPSLKNFPEKYLSLMFVDPTNPTEHLAYLCPMCLVNWTVTERSVGAAWNADFSLDHFPPQSVGGKFKMLVCKKCNNEAGVSVDYSLKQQLKMMSFGNKVKNSRIDATTTITGVKGNYKGELMINEEKETILGFNSEGKKGAPFLNQWINSPGDWGANITVKHADRNTVARALVRAAYLYCFGIWGYEFVFSRSGGMIRNFLNGDCEYPVNVPLSWMASIVQSQNIDHFPIGVCFLHSTDNCNCFIVNLVLENLETGFREIAAVPIPNPTETGWEDLAMLKEKFEALYRSGASVSIKHADQHTLKDDCYDGYSQTWHHLLQENSHSTQQ